MIFPVTLNAVVKTIPGIEQNASSRHAHFCLSSLMFCCSRVSQHNDQLEARSTIHAVGEFRRHGQSIFEDLVQAFSTRSNEAEVGWLLFDQLHDTEDEKPEETYAGDEHL